MVQVLCVIQLCYVIIVGETPAAAEEGDDYAKKLQDLENKYKDLQKMNDQLQAKLTERENEIGMLNIQNDKLRNDLTSV